MRPRKPCRGCGGEKLPGQGQRYCADCAENARWRHERKTANDALLHRRPCDDCGGVKEPGHGRRVCAACAQKRKEARAAARKAARHYYCRMCGAETGVPWATCRICKLRAKLKRKQRMKVYRERYNRKRKRRTNKQREVRRIDYRLKAERRGKPVTRRPPNGYVADLRNGEYIQLSAAPLIPFLEARLNDTPSSVLGAISRVAPEKIENIVQLKAATISLGSADRLCVELGVPFGMVYGGTEL